jgi:acetate kinase
MKILVINTGSSSIKYELFDMAHKSVLASGLAERIGEKEGLLTHRRFQQDGTASQLIFDDPIPDHHEGLNRIVGLLTHQAHGVIADKSEIAAVGHRVVHGGEHFRVTTVVDASVMEAIRENIPLAPLHNPANLTGIEVSRSVFPEAIQVAVFDTAFHQTIPLKAFLYAIPFDLYQIHKIRKYGFHGTSHAYVADGAAKYLNTPMTELNLITIHLGNGASMAAIKGGQCIDTSMGMTPLAGLVMGTRSGDLDPSIPFFMADHLGMSLDEIDNLLNKESGLRGICGHNDMREVIERMERGDQRAQMAIDLFTYRIKKYIGAYFAALGRLDGLIFTAGIGENAPLIREQCCEGLIGLGIEIDAERNQATTKKVREISSPGNPVKVLVVPTNEELRIAQETFWVVAHLG